MKNWSETEQIYRRLLAVLAEGRRAALATIIHTEGSTYRGPGAKILIEADGTMRGNISGGCLEGDVRERALTLLQRGGGPLRVTYETGNEQDALWGLGLGCDGKLELLLQVIQDPGIPQELVQRLNGDAPFAVRTHLLDGRMEVVASPDAENIADAFVERFHPPPSLVVCGADDGALPLVHYAAEASFRVTVVDHRPALLANDRFPLAHRLLKTGDPAIPRDRTTYAVLCNHHLERDRDLLQFFLAGDTAYIGLLGPTARRHALLDGVAASQQSRVYGPVGLDIGAVGHEQIAISIVAELLTVYAAQSRRD